MSTTRAYLGQNAHFRHEQSGQTAQDRILSLPGGRTAALVLSLRIGEESPDSTEQGARRKPGAVLFYRRAAWIGPQRRSLHRRCRVKRGNPHLLQPQAWPLT